MSDTTKTTPVKPTVPVGPQFHPAPGYILGKPLTRDEVSNLTTSLSLPELAGKEKDAVGVARVIEVGEPTVDDLIKLFRLQKISGPRVFVAPVWEGLKVGMLICYLPFTDAIILHGYEKRNLVPFEKIVAVADAPGVE